MLRAESVSYAYNGKKVLDAVTLELAAGEFTGIIGPNGAGKSTLLRIFSRIIPCGEGRVCFQGRPLESIGLKELARNMAVLPAETFHPYDFTVREIVAMGRSPYLDFWSEGGRADLEIVQGALDMVGIAHLAGRSIHALSSGERQMAFLAQAMAQQPKVLLLDEPTVHLDIQHQVQIFKLLKDWNQREKLTVGVISHDLNLAAQFCGKLALMCGGRVVVKGTAKEVITEENLKQTYGIEARVIASPGTGLPAVLCE